MRIVKSIKGVSLVLVTGLIALLMISTASINQLIINTSQNVRRIEASNKAYMAAEAGLEDALYELAPHFAGYQTPPLDDPDQTAVRTIDFGGDIQWESKWEIESRSGETKWGGKFFPGRKLIIFLYNDNNNPSPAPGKNEINDSLNANDITALNVSSNFSISFGLPDTSIIKFPATSLQIDNDKDGSLNEDPVGSAKVACSGFIQTEDDDCDGLINEDNDADAVILWKLTDGASRSLIPITGCLSDADSMVLGTEKSELCERDFSDFNDSGRFFGELDYSANLNQAVTGRNELGQTETISSFIRDVVTNNPDNKLQLEFLILAPMEHFDTSVIPNKRIEIPYFNYEVRSSATNQLPYPFFRIKSDGYYNKFKQSLTTTVSPKTTVPLFDFTVIQQQ